MTKIMFAILMLTFAAAAFNAQTNKQIASIRAEVDLINKAAPKYQKKTKSVEGISLEGTEATYFISGRGLKKVTAKMYGETFRATAEIYYSGEEVIFAYRRVERYDTQIAMKPPPKVVKIIETRVYFSGGDVVKVLDGKKQLAEASVEFAEAAEEIKEISDRLKHALE